MSKPPVSRFVRLFVTALVGALLAVAAADPAAAQSAGGDVVSCGGEGERACDLFSTFTFENGGQCDRGLFHEFNVFSPNFDKCLNLTRHTGAGTAFRFSWVGRALRSQLDDLNWDAPLNKLPTIISAHNGFNGVANGYLPMLANQVHSLSTILDGGFRAMELDLHASKTPITPIKGKYPKMCHAEFDHITCSPTDPWFSSTLKELRNWLRAAGNNVVMIVMENRVDDDYDYEIVDRSIRDHLANDPAVGVFSPADLGAYNDALIRGWFSQPADAQQAIDNPNTLSGERWAQLQWPTRAWLISHNKRVVFGGGRGRYGHRDGGSGGGGSLDDFTDVATCKTKNGKSVAGNGFYSDEWIAGSRGATAADLTNLTRCDASMIGLDHLMAASALVPPFTALDPGRVTGGVWSWAVNEPPSTPGDRAAMMDFSGRWVARASNESHRFLCARRDGDTVIWSLSGAAGTWGEGFAACGGGAARFDVPRRLSENDDARAVVGWNEVWMNFVPVDGVQDRWRVFNLDFEYAPNPTATGQATTFTPKLSTGLTLASATWDFGDGTPTVSSLLPTHTFMTAGTYTVRLTATDAKGRQAQVTKTLQVYSTEPKATFTTAPAQVVEGEPAVFTFNYDGNATLQSAKCLPANRVLSQSFVSASNTLTCIWKGGFWGSTEQTGTAEVIVVNPLATAAVRKDITVLNKAPVMTTTPVNLTGVLGTPVSQNISFTDSPGEDVKIVVDWGDGRGSQHFGPELPGPGPISNGTIGIVHQYPRVSGSPFTVTATLQDEAITVTRTFTVTLTGEDDTTKPELTVVNLSGEATGPGGRQFIISPVATDNFWPSVTVFCSMFPTHQPVMVAVGVWENVCTAIDHSDNATTKSHLVVVTDTTPPAVTVPDTIVIDDPGGAGPIVEFTSSAFDIVDLAITPACTPVSGSRFTRASTTVECVATDTAGNTGRKSFKVVINKTNPPAMIVPEYSTPRHHWRFEETSGQIALDYPASRLATGQVFLPDSMAYGAIDLGVAHVDSGFCKSADGVAVHGSRALSFLGGMDAAVNLGPVGAFGTNDFTLSFWFKTESALGGILLSTRAPGANPSGNDYIEIRLTDHGELWAKLGSSDVLYGRFEHPWFKGNDGQWHHVAVSRHSQAVLDGKLANVSGGGWHPGFMDITSTNPLRVGIWGSPGMTPGDAAIDDLRIWDRAVSFDEITRMVTNMTLLDEDGSCARPLIDMTVEQGSPDDDGPIEFYQVWAEDPFEGHVAHTCVYADGSPAEILNFLPLGVHNVVCTASDSKGHSNTTPFTVEVKRGTRKLLIVPDDIVTSATSADGAEVTYEAIVDDPNTGRGPASCTPASGSTFRIGQTLVFCRVTQTDGTTNQAAFAVTVTDAAPVITAVPDIVAEAAGPGGAAIQFTVPAATDIESGSLPVLCTHAPGTFPIGHTTVRCVATDFAGHQAEEAFDVHVRDTIAPVITVTLSHQPNGAGWYKDPVAVDWTVTDAVGAVSFFGCADFTAEDDTNGSVAMCTARDAAGNAATELRILKIDRTAPTVVFGDPSPTPANGWHGADTTVQYAIFDSTSGFANGLQLAGTLTFTQDGAGQTQSVHAVDLAGNEVTAASPAINIDRLPPTITGARLTPANAAGWNNTDVELLFECEDGGAGIATCPGTVTLTGEGADQSYRGVAVDRAGNTASFELTNIDIDRTAPIVSAQQMTPANGNGWNNGPVGLFFSGRDDLSGIDGDTEINMGIAQEGANQSVSQTFTDRAGNQASAAVNGINIDRTAPTITVDATPRPNAAGWNNSDVTVAFTCHDPLSGIASCTEPVQLASEGAGLDVSGVVVDQAGNTAMVSHTANIDKTAPSITPARFPAANANGWNNSDVTVSFTCGDSLSPVVECGASKTLGEGAAQSHSGTARDAAGNVASATMGGINVDQTAPVVSTSRTAANAFGWNNGPVQASFTATDALSGIAGAASSAITIATEGADQSATQTFTDLAGNSASASVTGVNIDLTAPTITGAPGTTPNASGWYNSAVTVNYTCGDALSGVTGACGPSQVLSQDGVNLSSTGTVTDRAGNTASVTVGGIRIDRTAPVLTCSNNGPALWPANHKLVTITAGVAVSGGISGAGRFTLLSATSNEADNGLGDGDTAHDIQGWTIGTADVSGQFRAERSGKGSGRIYTLTYQGLDLAGNSATCTTTVSVPHDQGRR